MYINNVYLKHMLSVYSHNCVVAIGRYQHSYCIRSQAPAYTVYLSLSFTGIIQRSLYSRHRVQPKCSD